MIRTGLEWAPGTTEESKLAIARLFKPDEILNAYRDARRQHKTGDLVLVATDQSPDILGGPRTEYLKHLRHLYGDRAREFKMWNSPAHGVVKLPFESNAWWFVLHVSDAPIQIMAVIYESPFEVVEETTDGLALS